MFNTSKELKKKSSQKITLAYSPDSDDAFMVYALKENKISLENYQSNFEFEFFIDDIQKLNESCLSCTYDICAISAATYPYISHNYELMTVGASVGQNFGPAIVVNDVGSGTEFKNIAQLHGKKVAVPGSKTTAFIAAKLLLPEFHAVPMHFLDIANAIKSGEVDAGILIHELQLNCHENGLKKIADLGSLWFSAHGLPLTLGLNAISKSLGGEKIQELTGIYCQSIVWGLANRESVLREASSQAVAGLSVDLTNTYIERYVNEDSLNFSRNVRLGLKTFYELAYNKNLLPFVATSELS